MTQEQGLSYSRRANDFMTIAAAMLVVAIIVLRFRGFAGQSLWASSILLAFLAYAVTIMRRRWDHLLAAAGFLAATLVSWILATATGASWGMDALSLLLLLVVWVPWPTVHNRRALLVLWALAVGPVAMLLVTPPVGDLSWLGAIITGERFGGPINPNELGIPAALGVVAVLALRLERDSWPRWTLQGVLLLLVAMTGTRSILPTVVGGALLWPWVARRLGVWRGVVVEVVPWAVFALVSVRPFALRSFSRGDSLDGLTSGRWHILGEYWEHARTSLLAGRGWGATEALLRTESVDTHQLPHNGFLTLMIDVGVPAMLVAVAGLVLYLCVRGRAITGPARWLLRLPIILFIPALFLIDHALGKAFLTIPVMLYLAATPWLSYELAEPRQWDGTPRPQFDAGTRAVR